MPTVSGCVKEHGSYSKATGGSWRVLIIAVGGAGLPLCWSTDRKFMGRLEVATKCYFYGLYRDSAVFFPEYAGRLILCVFKQCASRLNYKKS